MSRRVDGQEADGRGTTETHTYLKAKLQVGSIKSDVNYSAKEHVFHRESIPSGKLAIKKSVQRASRPDLLGLRQKDWDNSTGARQLCLREKKAIGAYDSPLYAYNYRAEVLPPKQPMPTLKKTKFQVVLESQRNQEPHKRPSALGRLEMPVHPDLMEKTFDLNSTFSPSLARSKFLEQEQERKRHCQEVSHQLTSSGKYHSLQGRYADELNATRAHKREERKVKQLQEAQMEQWGCTSRPASTK